MHSIDLLGPVPGRACEGSGYCCKKAPCPLVAHLLDELRENPWREGGPGCPELVWDEEANRYWCGIVLRDTGGSAARALSVGAGCCSALFNTERRNVR